ncbi:putative endonuclease [Flavobacteriaceae bacterium MAR_2010_188]|nr:putative endonuclease [Flavobacteriaceae bacterium MAR_2010_188]SDB62971.1 putative endonuclease [Flavobacteriaceae bacterium MAR_2010_188]
MFIVYILHSEKLNKYYCGQTQNMEHRLLQHNSGQGNYTSKGMPWVKIIDFKCLDRAEAMSLERKIKKRGIERYLSDK